LHEIHKEAELLEHLTSDFLIEKISTFLGHPEFDPHGDPIPKANGSISPGNDQISLSMAEPGHKYKVMRLFSSEGEFFNFCNNNKIYPGSIIMVENQYTKNKMTEIVIDASKIILNADFTNIIYVKQIKKDK
jgi:DtxR family Mn-dependent transcriptional regulator